MKCRFAPSPTGKIHIGNARSAILNWIFCQKNQGEFVLRIDDTDANRSSKEFETSIKDDLKWLGLNWSYTFNQSSRKNIYNEKIQILKQKKRLYPCFETEEELALKKKSLLSSGEFLRISSLIFLDLISSFLSLNFVSAIELSGSMFSVFNSLSCSIHLNIEFKSVSNFLAFCSSKEILDNLDICLTVLRSMLM